jgi:CheY-like chemotaxis protein
MKRNSKIYTILIAERKKKKRNTLNGRLVGDGYRTLLAKNGSEVLKALKREPFPDLIILDTDLSHVDGFQILSWIEEQNMWIPILLLTDYRYIEYEPGIRNRAVVVEKSVENLELITALVDEILKREFQYEQKLRRKQG